MKRQWQGVYLAAMLAFSPLIVHASLFSAQTVTQWEIALAELPPEQLTPIIAQLGDAWIYRKNEEAPVISDLLAKALALNPKATLAWFEVHPEQFDAWLESVPHTVLIDEVGTDESYAERVQLRAAMITSLVNYPKNQETFQYARRIDRVLRSSQIRQTN
ncbi:hypothetical protein VST7929_02817 [Vibrio stylophorae]|uniref:Uncharacterized protein n=1 Tax=Vibrio stylophorae TaxID=659351 RepID=A0ABM8ZX07_9VIBR|nr:hypothetical protein [Vibrio stylophorae]CAH0535156.1 hypothetical protein VST7929_02817 [Vibrio stylophorae]